ncbi:MoaF-related domain-containing protein [Streptacidiphilus fuscans]|uniref:MoaF-like domain-containing protein n=1 Tax=Streptacidiphilus fuscans TaxID=2789292 RepID=A0A931AZS0_9ACTN|nr:hypothetical protein [Streptacidiphilus fuscans]MBF9068429.1 hypothetical protein [Streptacidiphilus fuscans]
MRTRPVLLAAAATVLAAATTTAAVTTASAATTRVTDTGCHTLDGHTFQATTDVGFNEKMAYNAAGTQLTATVTSGGPFGIPVGTVLTENVSTAKVADGIYTVSWIEPGNFTVTEAQDLNSGTMQLFWSYPDSSGNQVGEQHKGTVTCLAG